MILAIDPANELSAYVIMDDNYKPVDSAKILSYELNDTIGTFKKQYEIDTIVIEMIASYGMAVGKTVFDTCVWVGRFIESANREEIKNIELVYRKDVKMNLCHSMKAKDANVRQALIDRFGVVGTKNNKGWFYGFAADIWAAYAVGVTYMDKRKGDDF